MATKVYKFRGICNWAKVHTPDKTYGNYQIDLIMTEPSWDLFKRSGMQLKTKEKDGEKFVTFRRNPKQEIKGKTVDFGKPEVLDSAGRAIDDLIGNGSEVDILVSVYDSKKGKGHRMDTVIVRKLVAYGGEVESADEGDVDYDEDGDKYTEPKEETKKSRPKTSSAAVGLDDEIPF